MEALRAGNQSQPAAEPSGHAPQHERQSHGDRQEEQALREDGDVRHYG